MVSLVSKTGLAPQEAAEPPQAIMLGRLGKRGNSSEIRETSEVYLNNHEHYSNLHRFYSCCKGFSCQFAISHISGTIPVLC